MAAFASSYIKTEASQVTRTADVAVMTGTNFSEWYRQDEGTFVIEGDTSYTASNFPVFSSVSDGTGNNIIDLNSRGSTTTTRMEAYVGGVVQVAAINSTTAVLSGVSAKTSRTYKLNDYALSCGGETVKTDTSATVPTVDRIHIGSYLGSSGFTNGHISSITYYPKRVTNSELQALSTI